MAVQTTLRHTLAYCIAEFVIDLPNDSMGFGAHLSQMLHGQPKTSFTPSIPNMVLYKLESNDYLSNQHFESNLLVNTYIVYLRYGLNK